MWERDVICREAWFNGLGMENQMEKAMEHDINFGENMDIQRVQGLGFGLVLEIQ